MDSGLRDWRIDFWRGAAILMIFVNHIPDNVVSLATTRSYGFSDAAELFVFLSGYSVATLFMARFRDQPFAVAYFAASRACYLYLYHLAMVLVLACIAVAMLPLAETENLIHELQLYPFVFKTEEVIGQVLTLAYQPTFLDILPLYIVLTALAAAFFIVFGERWVWYVVASLALYAFAHVARANLPSFTNPAGWFFNPLAWQLVFMAGFVCRLVRDQAWLQAFLRSDVMAWVAAAVVAVGVVAAAPWAYQGLVLEWRPLDALFAYADKQYAAPLRLLHFFCATYLGVRLISREAAWDTGWFGAILCAIGQRALRCFVLATLLSVVMRAVLYLVGPSANYQIFVSVVGVAIIAAVAVTMKTADELVPGAKRPA